jgi:hypothetical protein
MFSKNGLKFVIPNSDSIYLTPLDYVYEAIKLSLSTDSAVKKRTCQRTKYGCSKIDII